MKNKWIASAASTVVLASGLTGVPAAPAFASDAFPCGAPWNHPPYGTVQTCPDWSPNRTIPVYYTAFPNSEVIGTMVGGSNWYVCQMQTSGESVLGSSQNDWWARTMADNGNWGWVPETYFRGGDNDEADGGLAYC